MVKLVWAEGGVDDAEVRRLRPTVEDQGPQRRSLWSDGVRHGGGCDEV